MSILNIFNKQSSISYIIAGLGNPGTQYENTRHNAGFMAVDTLAHLYNADINKIKFKALCTEIIIADKKCLILKPSTFMNNSGQSIIEAMNFYKIPIENLIVIYDDISLPPSKIRVRRKGTDGGHNGIKSIIYLSNSDSFPRIKIGVGNKPHPDYNLADWVLSRFKSDEIPLIQSACRDACSCIELIVNGNINDAMNKFN